MCIRDRKMNYWTFKISRFTGGPCYQYFNFTDNNATDDAFVYEVTRIRGKLVLVEKNYMTLSLEDGFDLSNRYQWQSSIEERRRDRKKQ